MVKLNISLWLTLPNSPHLGTNLYLVGNCTCLWDTGWIQEFTEYAPWLSYICVCTYAVTKHHSLKNEHISSFFKLIFLKSILHERRWSSFLTFSPVSFIPVEYWLIMSALLIGIFHELQDWHITYHHSCFKYPISLTQFQSSPPTLFDEDYWPNPEAKSSDYYKTPFY